MARRSDARKQVLQMLYLIDQNPEADVRWIRQSMEEALEDESLIDFAWRLFTGVREKRVEIDAKISEVAANWRVERMAPTDRNAIRIGLYEIQSLETPKAVVVNECIELAREFGTENSAAFVNGILDRFGNPESPVPAATAPE